MYELFPWNLALIRSILFLSLSYLNKNLFYKSQIPNAALENWL